MASTGIDEYIENLRQFAESAAKTDEAGSPGYYRKVLACIHSGNSYLQAVYEELLGQFVREDNFERLRSVFYHEAKAGFLPFPSGYDHCWNLWSLLDLFACADAENVYRVFPEGLPLSGNGYPMYVNGTNVLLCLLYNTDISTVYVQDKVVAKAEKFVASKKPMWERAVVSALLAVLAADVPRFSEALQNVCIGYGKMDIAPCKKIQCQNAYGLLMLARRFWTEEKFAAVVMPEAENFSKGYAEWLLGQEKLPDDLCITYEAPIEKVNEILKKPVAVTRIYQKYLDSDSAYLSSVEKKAWYLDCDRMMEELLGVEAGTFQGQGDDKGDKAEELTADEPKKPQQHIDENSDELPAEEKKTGVFGKLAGRIFSSKKK